MRGGLVDLVRAATGARGAAILGLAAAVAAPMAARADTMPAIGGEAAAGPPAAPGLRATHIDANTRPNIVILASDDMGWGQPGFNGGGEVPTPSMDRIADEGVKFTQFYVQPICSPTRASLMTGRYAWKNGMERRPSERDVHGMLRDERTMAEALRKAGYATWIVGKWHLGHWYREHLPNQRGFDHHYGFYGAEIDSFTHRRNGNVLDWHRNGRPVVESGYTTFLLADEAVGLIERHDSRRSFFLYLPFNAVHNPNDAPEHYVSKYNHLGPKEAKQRGQLEAMDVAIGRVLDALERKRMASETLVMFLNDNGGNARLIRPYRKGRGSYYEGGIRVPAVLRWPEHVRSGSQSDALLHAVDLFPTFAMLAGASTGGGQPLDGIDAWAAIADGADSPRTEIVHSRNVIRMGDWKLIEENGDRFDGKPSPLQLYDIGKDPYERRNLAARKANKVAKLRARLEHHRRFGRDGEPKAEIPDFPPVVLGEEENAAFGDYVRKAISERKRDNPAPTFQRLEICGAKLTLVYDEALDGDSTPGAGTFTVVRMPGHKATGLRGVHVSETEVILTLDTAVDIGESVGVTYEVPMQGSVVQRKDGLEAVGLTWSTTTPEAPGQSVSDAEEEEGADLSFDVALASAVPRCPVSVRWATEDGSAKAGLDYQAGGGLLEFEPGETSKTATVATLADTLVEGDETLTVRLSEVVGARLVDGEATRTIEDVPVPEVQALDATAAEGSVLSFQVTLARSAGSGSSGGPVTVRWATGDGSAKAGADYEAASGLLEFGPGETAKTATVATLADTVVEGEETLTVRLSEVTGARLADAEATGTIEDVPVPEVHALDAAAAEGSALSFQVTLTSPVGPGSAGVVTVRWATADGTAIAGSDYEAGSRLLRFAAGETRRRRWRWRRWRTRRSRATRA